MKCKQLIKEYQERLNNLWDFIIQWETEIKKLKKLCNEKKELIEEIDEIIRILKENK